MQARVPDDNETAGRRMGPDTGSVRRPFLPWRTALPLLALLLGLTCAACGTNFSDNLSEADTAYAEGNYYQAQRLYENYLQVKPQGKKRWEAWNKLLDIAVLLENDLPKAAQLLEAMLLEFAESPERESRLRLRLARTYTELAQWDKALEAWQAVLSDEDRPMAEWEVHWNMGKVYQFQGKYAQARQSMSHCREMAATGADKARCSYDLALANSFLGQRDQARQWLEKVMAEPGASAELKALSGYQLAEILEMDGHKDEARKVLESIKDTYPNPKAVELRLKRLAE